MYFATNSARALSSRKDGANSSSAILSISANPRKTHFCVLTDDEVAVWRIRPPILLASLNRTAVSLKEHGNNKSGLWSPDGSRIVIQTTASHVVIINVFQTLDFQPFQRLSIPKTSRPTFLPGPGEGTQVEGLYLQLHGVISIEGELTCLSPRNSHILFSTKEPAAVQRMPWPQGDGESSPDWLGHETWMMDRENFGWLQSHDAKCTVTRIYHMRGHAVESWITDDGRAYFVQLSQASADQPIPEGSNKPSPKESWHGACIYPPQGTPKSYSKPSSLDAAVELAMNPTFSIVSVGLQSGKIMFAAFPSLEGTTYSDPITIEMPNMHFGSQIGPVTAMDWTSDGYALAVGWEHGWAILSVGGRVLTWASKASSSHPSLQDMFMRGVSSLFWGPSNFELFITSNQEAGEEVPRMFAIPFVKSSFTTQQTPDNTRYAFLVMDDRVLVYRGADQPDMSVINPESDVWQHIKIPVDYMANNWPLRYCTISSDGRLIAVAGRRGLTHYSMASGRWKMFDQSSQEQAFFVRGGLLWFHHVLIAAVEMANKAYRVQSYSRDLDLGSHTILHTELFDAPIVTLSLVDNSLLVYTANNELYHYLVMPTADTVSLHACGSISFAGVVASPHLVRGMSWMIPPSQKNFGDTADDLTAATIQLLVGGQLVLLTPHKNSAQTLRYDLRILADRIEFCWIHLRGVGALENSLWGYDGEALRIWLDGLAINANPERVSGSNSVVENVRLPLDFYPLSVLMDKGIIIGAEQEVLLRSSLPFAIFRLNTASHLFIHHVLRYHLQKRQIKEAVQFAQQYQNLVFFSHSLEVLLHTVLESEDDAAEHETILPAVIEFLDHFDVSLEVIVGCARKTEMTRWKRLFDAVGNPRNLFEACMREGRLTSAASYLLVLHNLQQLEETGDDAVRLLSRAMEANAVDIAKDLMRFLRSIDEDGTTLVECMRKVGLGVTKESQ